MTDIFSLSEDLRREQRENQESFRLALQNQVQKDPARARRILNVSAATGLSGEVVDSDLDNLENLVVSREFDVDKWQRESPAWASFASENPYHLAVLKDDQENMGTFERAFNQIGLGWDSTWATVELGRIRSRQVGGDEREGDEERLKELKQLTVGHEFGAENPVIKLLVKTAKMAGPTIASMGKGLEFGLAGAIAGGTAAGIAGQAGPQVAFPEEILTVPAASLVGFQAGFASGTSKSAFGLERGFAYDEYLEMGVDPQTAKLAANSVGVVNAALEMVSIGKAVKYVPWLRGGSEKAAKQLAGEVLSTPTVARASAAVVGRFGEVLGTEVVTEVMQETVTAVTGEIVGDADLTWDSYVDRISEVALETLQGAAIMSSIGPGMSYYSDLTRANAAKNMESVYKALGQSATDSTTRANVPAKYQEFVRRLTKNGPIQKILLDAGRFREYFQEVGQDPNEVAADLGVTNFDEATEAGLDIEIPIGQYAEKIAPTEAHNALVGDLKSDPEQMSAREAALFEKNKPERLKELEALTESQVEEDFSEEVFNDVLGQLIAADVERGAAEKQARLTASAFSTLARRADMDPVKLFEEFFSGVKRVEDPAKRDVDVVIDPLLDRLRKGEVPGDRDIFGESLTEFLKSQGGIWDDGGELHARDVGKQVPFLLRKQGMTLDHAAEVAHEAGYLLARDPNILLDAIDKEMRGEPVFGPGADPEMETLRKSLNDLDDFLEAEGIDLESMDNPAVRKALESRRSFNQIDDSEMADLTQFVTALITGGENPELLGKIEGLIPRIDDKQDFGDLDFTDRLRVEGTTESVEVTQSAQKVFDRAVKKRNVFKKLLDCVSG